ncbi:MAG TPA: hypothetical protein VK043_12460 [Burkholderiales bacterium]|nr:hypothetical protein [Burkholderiales bacterium]
MGYQQNPSTGETYWVNDSPPTGGYGEQGYQDPFAGMGEGPRGHQYATGNRPAGSAGKGLLGAATGGLMQGAQTAATAIQNAARPQQPPQPQPQPDYSMPQGDGALRDPGNNLLNPGWAEQAFNYTQNQYLDNPYAAEQMNAYGDLTMPTQGERQISQNMGTLSGPGQGDQYWNKVSGQFQDPFAGEQYTREATQNFSPTGAAGAFYDQAQGQYDQFTNYQGPGNTQGQYNASSGALSGGTAGEGHMEQLLQQQGTTGTFSDPNRAAGQYEQTQGAFGDMPIADFDPFYDRARQLATQDYNRQSAGRGVYGSSEALSGVGNVITDIEAQRANRSFDAEMQRAQEQRARQQLLGEQARMGDLSGIEGYKANLQGTETYGNLAKGMGELEIDRHEALGSMANQADSQARDAQDLNLRGVQTYGDLAGQADRAETDRYTASTGAMNQADRNQTDRLRTGADIAQGVDEGNRADFTAEANAAFQGGNLELDRQKERGDRLQSMGDDQLKRLESFMGAANTAEANRMTRQIAKLQEVGAYTQDVQNAIGGAMSALLSGDQAAFDQVMQSQIAPALQAAGFSQQQTQQFIQEIGLVIQGYAASNAGKK